MTQDDKKLLSHAYVTEDRPFCSLSNNVTIINPLSNVFNVPTATKVNIDSCRTTHSRRENRLVLRACLDPFYGYNLARTAVGRVELNNETGRQSNPFGAEE